MVLIKTIVGEIQPKLVLASPNGLVSAQNMMYKHLVTFYDSNTFELKTTVPDQVNLTELGFTGYTGTYQGAPVEGAYSPDGKYLYVTNYAMYGKSFNHEGHDVCSPSSGYDSSFLYRINLETFKIDAAYKVGTVPKVVKKIKIGAYPRGITVSNDSAFAYVAQMGGSVIHQINLKTFADKTLLIEPNPRALVFSPDQKTIYATLNASGKVVALDLVLNKVVKTVTTGKATRSLDISSDGTALFVVNFNSETISKIRTSDFKVIQTMKVCPDPIGVTYEPINDRTWVVCYKGSIKVFDNK